MDVNELYFDYQIAVMRAARSDPLERSRFELAAANTAERIGQLQRSLGAKAGARWEVLALVSPEAQRSRSNWMEGPAPSNLTAPS